MKWFLTSIRTFYFKSKFNYYLINILGSFFIWGAVAIIFSLTTEKELIAMTASLVVADIIFFLLAPYKQFKEAWLNGKSIN